MAAAGMVVGNLTQTSGRWTASQQTSMGGFHGLLPQGCRSRSSCTLRGAVLEEASTSAPAQQWFTRPDRSVPVKQPVCDAELLECQFWHHPTLEVPATTDEAMVLMERLQQETAVQGTAEGINVVAFTGGNGPALAAYLLNSVFDGAVVACIGDVTRLPQEQVEHASYIADLLGIDLIQVDATTWERFEVRAALDTAVDELCENLAGASCEEAGMAVFSGATADDVSSFSRTGGQMQGIKAPLAGLSRAAVNVLSKAVGLPDWNAASSKSTRQPTLVA